jgi:hypothetical protein
LNISSTCECSWEKEGPRLLREPEDDDEDVGSGESLLLLLLLASASENAIEVWRPIESLKSDICNQEQKPIVQLIE